MKVVITAKGKEWNSPMDPRFGRCEYFFIYDEENDTVDFYDNREIEGVAHGAGPQTAGKLAEVGADVLITGNGPGGNAASVLEKTGVEIYLAKGDYTVEQAYELYKEGKLEKF